MRLSIAFLALLGLLSIAPTVHAQSVHLDVDTQLRPVDHELESINAESTAATVLYVTGTIVAVTGAGIVMGAAIAHSSPYGGGDYSLTTTAGIGIGVIGLLALGIAIGLDVDSGSRRRGHTSTHVALQPSLDGCTLAVSGSF